jgi:drug/metabolite transporter (DMT)-like permease
VHNEPLSAGELAQRLRGIGLMLATAAMFACVDSSSKFATQAGVPTLEVVWARYAISLVVAAAILRPWKHPADYVTRRPMSQALRALFLLMSTTFNFIAIQHMQLSESAAINFVSPLVITALAGPILGEWAGWHRWAAVAVGFIGVLVVIQPTPGSFNPAVIASLANAAAYAGYALSTRMLSATETPSSMLVYASLVSTVVLLPALPATHLAVPSAPAALAMLICGTCGAFGHLFVIHAYRHAPAMVLAPFSYTQMLWMVVIGYLVFGDLPVPATLVGAAVIVASGLYILYRQQVHRDRR